MEKGVPDVKPMNRVKVTDRRSRSNEEYDGYITHVEQNNSGILIRLDTGFSLQFIGPIESVVVAEVS